MREMLEKLNPKVCRFKIMNKKGYGFEENKPIMVKSVAAEYEIIQRLHLKGYCLNRCYLKDVERESIIIDGFSGPVDHFEVMFDVFGIRGVTGKMYDIYFCAYPPSGEKEYTKEEKIKEYQKIVSNNMDIPIPKDFATKHVEHTQKGTVLSVW